MLWDYIFKINLLPYLPGAKELILVSFLGIDNLLGESQVKYIFYQGILSGDTFRVQAYIVTCIVTITRIMRTLIR